MITVYQYAQRIAREWDCYHPYGLKNNGDVWCDSQPYGSSVGYCAQPAVVQILRDFAQPEDRPWAPSFWVSSHCAEHAKFIRDTSAYRSERPFDDENSDVLDDFYDDDYSAEQQAAYDDLYPPLDLPGGYGS